MGKGDTYRPVGPNYAKNFNRMDGSCNTCCHFLGDDKPVSEHCKKKRCRYERIKKLVDFLSGEHDV